MSMMKDMAIEIQELFEGGMEANDICEQTGYSKELVDEVIECCVNERENEEDSVEEISSLFTDYPVPENATLKDVLEKAMINSPETNYCIGASSGYFFIGTANDALADLHAVWEPYKNDAVKRLQTASHNIPILEAGKKETRKKMDEVITQHPASYEELDEYKSLFATFKSYKARLEVARRNVDKYSRYLIIYGGEDFLVRKVQAIHDRTVDDSIVIIVEGTEQGRFWFKSEYDEAKKGESK